MPRGVTFDLRGNNRSFRSAVQGAQGSVLSFRNTIKSSLGGLVSMSARLATLQTNMLGVNAAFRAFQGVKSATTDFASFEEGLKKIEAVTQSTKPEMAELTELVKKLGFETQFTVEDIEKAVFNLGTLGVKGPQAFRDLMPSIVNAAVSLDTDLNRAAEVVLSTIKTFNLTAKDSAHVVDLLTNAYTNSSLNIEKFAVASQYAGLAAKTFKRPLEDVLPLLMALTNQGIDAGIAGTQIRTGFLKLLKPTRAAAAALKEMGLSTQDVSVESFGFVGVLDKLTKAGMTNAQAIAIFGIRAMPVIQALLKIKKEGKTGVEVLKEYQRALGRAGEGARQSALRQTGLGFRMKQVAAATGLLSVNIGDAINKMFGLEDKAGRLADAIGIVGKYVENLNFDTLKNAGFTIFDPSQIGQNLETAFSDTLPKAMDFAASAALYGASEFLVMLADNGPKIVTELGSLAVKLLFKGAGGMAGIIIDIAKNVGLFFSRIVANIQEKMGQMLKLIPGWGDVGENLIDAAKWRREGNIGMAAYADELKAKTSDLFRDMAALSSEGFRSAVEAIAAMSDFSRELRKSAKDFQRDRGLTPENTGKKGAAVVQSANRIPTEKQREAVNQVVNDHSVNVNYRQQNRNKQIASKGSTVDKAGNREVVVAQ